MSAEGREGLSRSSAAVVPLTVSSFVFLGGFLVLMSALMFAFWFGAINNPESLTPPLVPLSLAVFLLLCFVGPSAYLLSLQKFKVRHRILAQRFPKAIVLSTANGIDRWEPEISAGEVKANKNFTAVADDVGLTFWGGHREPREFKAIQWRDVAKVSVARYDVNGLRCSAVKVEGKSGTPSVTMSSLSTRPLRLEIVDRAAHQALARSLENLRLGAGSNSRTQHDPETATKTDVGIQPPADRTRRVRVIRSGRFVQYYLVPSGLAMVAVLSALLSGDRVAQAPVFVMVVIELAAAIAVLVRAPFLGVWLYDDRILARTLWRTINVNRSDLENCFSVSFRTIPPGGKPH